jgi:uncharacterized membrane protein
MHTTFGTADPCPETDAADAAAARAASVVTAATLAVAFSAMALGIPWFWVAFPVGFGLVMPLAIGYARRGTAGDRGHDRDLAERDPALAALRERYARGEIDEAEFEARVEGLVATENEEF